MKQNIETVKSCKGGLISFATTKKYANIACQSDGFYIVLSDRAIPQYIVRKIGNENSFILPVRILKAYGLVTTANIKKMSDTQYFVTSNNPVEDIPQILNGESIIDLTPIPDLSQSINTYKRVMVESKVMLKEGFRLGSLKKVVLHFGQQQYIEMTKATEEDQNTYPTIYEIYEEYGRNFQHYAGEMLTFIKDEMNEDTFVVPKTFLKLVNMTSTSEVRICKLADGRVVIAPPQTKCEITKQIIEPVQHKAVKVRICEDCNDHLSDTEKLLNLQKEYTLKYNLFEIEKNKMQTEADKAKDELASMNETMKQCIAAANKTQQNNKILVDMIIEIKESHEKEIGKLKERIEDANDYKVAFQNISRITSNMLAGKNDNYGDGLEIVV